MPTINDLLGTNFGQRVGGWLASLGGYAYALAQAVLNFPGYTLAQITSAVNRIQQGFSAGSAANALQPAQTLWRDDIPVNPNIPEAYQYVVRLTCLNQVSGIYTYPIIAIDSDTALTQDQIKEEVDQKFQASIPTHWTGANDTDLLPGPNQQAPSPINEVSGMEIIYVSRRT